MPDNAPQLSLFPEPAAQPRGGHSPEVAVRESGRARRLSIKVYPRGRVEVVVPRRTRPADVERFVNDNRDWIRRAREEFGAAGPDEPFRLPDILDLPAVGRRFAVSYVPEPGASSVRFRIAGPRILLRGRTGDEQLCVTALRRCLSTIARREFEPRLAALSALTDIDFARLQIRAQRTCWGSRSSTGTLCLNLCLLFVAPPLMRYLMIHELCHGRHMNHSRRFWNLVGRFEPDYRRLDRALGDAWRVVPAWLGIC